MIKNIGIQTKRFINNISSTAKDIKVVDTTKKIAVSIVNTAISTIIDDKNLVPVKIQDNSSFRIDVDDYSSSTTAFESTAPDNYVLSTSETSIDSLFSDDSNAGLITNEKINLVKKYLKSDFVKVININASTSTDLSNVGNVGYTIYGNIYNYLKYSVEYNSNLMANYSRPVSKRSLESFMMVPIMGYTKNFRSLEKAEDSYNDVLSRCDIVDNNTWKKQSSKAMFDGLFLRRTIPSIASMSSSLTSSFIRYPVMKEFIFGNDYDSILVSMLNQSYAFYSGTDDADAILDIISKKSILLIESHYLEYTNSIKDSLSKAYQDLINALSNAFVIDKDFFLDFIENQSELGKSITNFYNALLKYFTMEKLDYTNISNYYIDEVYNYFNNMLQGVSIQDVYSMYAYSMLLKTTYMLGKFFNRSDMNVNSDDINTYLYSQSQYFIDAYNTVIKKFKDGTFNLNIENYELPDIISVV